MNIVFVQLPLLDHGYNYILGNIPNAPSTLQAFCLGNYRTKINAIQLPQTIQNFGSDPLIIDTILHHNPTHVAFSCYLWNVERSRAIAQRIKALTPKVTILFGGPEIQLQSYILRQHHPEVDMFIIGEGEFFFEHYFHATHTQYLHTINGNAIFIQPANSFVPLKKMVEPYTQGYLQPMYDGSLSVEVIRGCPFTCKYCLYSKNTSRVRAFPANTLQAIIRKAKKDTIQEIYLLAPTFNQSKHFVHYCNALIESHNSIPLHTEIRADRITKESIALLQKAGFHSLEVGLQTMNQTCLNHIGRKTNAQKELEGIVRLKDAGFKLQVGIIPGLPTDTPKSFMNTMDTLLDYGLGNEIELYPLMVLPGTALYDEALQQGATFMQQPPYYFIEGFNFSQNDLHTITQYFEDATGFVFNPPFIPSFIMNKKGTLTSSVLINCKKHKTLPGHIFNAMQTNHFIFYILCDSSSQIDLALQSILSHCQFHTMLYSVVCIYNDILDDSAIARTLLAATKDTFYYHMMHFQNTYDRLPVRIFQLFETLETFLRAQEHYACINPILLVNPENYTIISHKEFAYPFPIVIQKGFAKHCIDWLKQQYSESIELVSFQDEADQKYVYKKIGITYSQITFKTKYI
ncbi:MAG: radical SAM protein [Spirochaetota bacterium]